MGNNIKENDTNIIFVGLSGIPDAKDAACNYIHSLGKGLIKVGCKVSIINRFPYHERQSNFRTSNNINYYYPANNNIRETNKFKRKYYRVVSQFLEIKHLLKIFRNNKNSFVYIYTESILSILKYLFLSRLFGAKVILSVVEKRSTFEYRHSFFTRVNDYLVENHSMKWVDGVIPITNHIDQEIKKLYPKVRTLIIPPICDFELFEKHQRFKDGKIKYFLYCGTIAYKEVIEFVLNSFKCANLSEDYYLYLVTNADSAYKKQLEEMYQNVRIFSNVPYDQLISLYKGALGLLIPLRNVERDINRFPYKVSEYVASKNLIITTNVGEMRNYFKDEKNALVANNYDVVEFSEKIKLATNLNDKRTRIIETCYNDLSNFFDNKSSASKIKTFVSDVI